MTGEFARRQGISRRQFLRDDTQIQTFLRMREAVGKAGWNLDLIDKPQAIEDLKFDNYVKEIYLDSDTKIASAARPRMLRRIGS